MFARMPAAHILFLIYYYSCKPILKNFYVASPPCSSGTWT